MRDDILKIVQQAEQLRRIEERAFPLRKYGITPEMERIWSEDRRLEKLFGTIGDSFDQFPAARVRQQAMDIVAARRAALTVPEEYLRSHTAAEAAASYAANFIKPPRSDLQYLADEAMKSSLIASNYGFGASDLRSQLGKMTQTWAWDEAAGSSARALSDLWGIGRALSTGQGFDERFTGNLRDELGDWRDAIEIDEPTIIQPLARTDFYIERGLDTELTDFTPEAFEEALGLAGLSLDTIGDDADEDAGLARANAAFGRLQRLEVAVRRFISAVMAEHFGDDWMAHRLPKKQDGPMHEDWERKRQIAINAGQPERPLIDYADFTDYKAIIEMRQNWPAFKPYFGRSENIRESFQRLFPIRIASMHARIVTLDDLLLTVVETKRILSAIGSA